MENLRANSQSMVGAFLLRIMIAFVCGLVASMTACSHHNQQTQDTLIVALSAEPSTLDPRYATDATGMRITSLIFSSLVHLGPNLEAVPEAAERWTFRDNVYTFFLRRDLKFHNGRALRAEDVEFSFAQFLAQGSASASMLDLIRKVDVVPAAFPDPIRVRIHVTNYSDKFLKADLPSIKLLPKAELLAAGPNFSKALIGTGGFRLIRQSSYEIELEGVTAASKHLIFKIIHDDFTRYQKMRKGELDIAQMEITPERVADFQQHPDKFTVFLYPGLSMTYILVNFRDPLLRQRPVREALAQAISRQDLIRFKMKGLAREATSILTPASPYFNSALKNLSFDLGAARERIHALGLEGREITLKTSNSPQAIDNGKVLAYQMSQAGLKVQLQSYEWGTFYGDVKRGNFQLATMRWVGTVDPDIYKLAFDSKEVPPGRNRGSYRNERLDRLLAEGTSLANFAERKKIFNEVQELVLEDLAIIPLWYDQQIAIIKTNVRNYTPTQTGDYWPLMEASKAHE